jgi:hypothetical protein
MVMLTVFLALFVGTFSGTVAGGLVSWWLLDQPSAEPVALDHLTFDPDVDDQISRAANQWAETHHRPEAAPLVADKLRLVHALNQRRQRRSGRGRWER